MNDTIGNTNEMVEANERVVLKQKDIYDEDSSSSGDEDDDDDDDEEDSNVKVTEAGATNSPDGTSTVLKVPLRYTKSGRKRSIPFPVRVSDWI